MDANAGKKGASKGKFAADRPAKISHTAPALFNPFARLTVEFKFK